MLRCEISLLDVTNSQTEMTPRSTRVAKIFASFLSSSPSYRTKKRYFVVVSVHLLYILDNYVSAIGE